MTDKELLELAAKAAGAVELDGDLYVPNGTAGKSLFNPDGAVSTGWNSLNDEGDALRLAIQLGMNLCLMARKPFAIASANFMGNGTPRVQITELNGKDGYESACRAIVRAAAEIGKSLDNVNNVDKHHKI
jgi:hypothetical protein